MQIGSGTRYVDVENIVRDVEDHKLREELRSPQKFLVDSQLEKERHKLFNYAVGTLNETIVKQNSISFPTIRNVDQKEVGFLFHFEKKQKTEDSDSFTHTKTIA